MTTNEQKMCGFVGLFDIRQKSDALRTQVLKMSKNIRHRGPDWSGVYCGERAILSHERLSIVDPQSGGQPLFSRDGKLVLAVNGDGTLLLQAGRMKMTVKAQQVRLLEGAPKKSKPAPSSSAATLNTVSRASSELDIRGYETLEAESVVENYLDAASRSPRLDMASLGVRTGAPVQHSLLLLFFQRPPRVSGASGFGNRAFFLRQPGMETAFLCAPGAPSG